MVIILIGSIVSMAWGLWRVLNSKQSTPMQQNLGLAGILIGALVAIISNISKSDPGLMTVAALLAGACMLILAIFCVSAMRRPEGGANRVDLAAILFGVFTFLVGSVFH